MDRLCDRYGKEIFLGLGSAQVQKHTYTRSVHTHLHTCLHIQQACIHLHTRLHIQQTHMHLHTRLHIQQAHVHVYIGLHIQRTHGHMRLHIQ